MPVKKSLAKEVVGKKKPVVKSMGGSSVKKSKKGAPSSTLKMPGAKTKSITSYKK